MPRKRPLLGKLPPGLKLRGAMYTMDFQYRGKSYVKSTGLKVTQENALQLAKELLADYRYQVRTGQHLPKVCAQITLRQVLEQWESAQDNTAWKTYRRAVLLLCEFLDGDLHPNEAVSTLRVANYVRWRMAQPTQMAHGTVTWQTCKEELRILQAALTCAADENQIDTIKVVRPRMKAAPRGQTSGKRHHPAKLASFLERAHPRVGAFITFCRWTGARAHEALRLKPEHIRATPTGKCKHEVTLIQQKGKQIRRRTVGLNDRAFAAVEYGQSMGKETVFPWPKISQRCNGENRRLGYARSEYVTARDMRHLIATEMYEATGNLAQVSKFLGHATLAMTERYLHPDEPQLAEATADWLATR